MTRRRAISDIVSALSSNPVFGVLSAERLNRFASSGAWVGLDPRACLFEAGDEADALFIVLSGEVAVTSQIEDGREMRLATLGRGAVVGEMGVLDGGPRSASVQAISRTELWRIARESVMNALREEPEAALTLLALLVRRLRATDVLAQELALLDLGGRLARLLAESETPIIAQSQGDIARRIGASRERVNRKLAEWRDAGWIEVGPYGVKILNRVALTRHGQLAATI